MLSESDARAILKKVLGYSKADEAEATLTGSRSGNLRSARNAVSTSGGADSLDLTVQSSFGKKTGIATINEFDDASLERTVRRAEELARLAPENPEYVPFLGPQKYTQPPGFFDATADITPEWRAKMAAVGIAACRDAKLTSSCFLSHDAGFTAVANTHGLDGYFRDSGVDYSVTVRTADGKGSGYGVSDFNDATKMDTASRHAGRHPEGAAFRGTPRHRAGQIHRHPRARRQRGPHQPHGQRHGRAHWPTRAARS